MGSTELDRIVSRDHPSPHSYLGAHPQDGGVVFRAYRPDAEGVRVDLDGSSADLARIHPAGVFEGVLPGVHLPLRYRLQIRYTGGQTFSLLDPYAFLPTLGEIDLYLAGEGRHEELYERLGAHVRTLDGVEGVAFAVWAPSARSVSVVGDFNT